MIASGITSIENHFAALGKDFAALTKKGPASDADKQASSVALIRIVGTAGFVVGAGVALASALLLPVSLLHPAALLVTISTIALAALGALIGYDLIKIANNREAHGIMNLVTALGKSVINWLSDEENKTIENLAHEFTKNTFFEPIWTKLQVITWKRHLSN